MKKTNCISAMQFQNKTFSLGISLLTIATFVSYAHIANAASFNFFFSHKDGSVESTIELSDGDFSHQSETSMIISSRSFAILLNFSNLNQNKFSVVNLFGTEDNSLGNSFSLNFASPSSTFDSLITTPSYINLFGEVPAGSNLLTFSS
jgi:hypothetical protein